MTKVVVTGGAGFIGSHIVDALVDEGYDVHIIDNLSTGKKETVNEKAMLHVVDIRDYDKVREVMKGAKYVFHQAARPRVQYSIEYPEETNDVNVNGTLSVLRAAHDSNVKRLVYAASSSAYGSQERMPLVETMVPNPLSPYGAQKYMGEAYCRVWSHIHNLETVCLRYFSVYGPRFNADGTYALVIGMFLKQRNANKPMTITGDGSQTRDFTHVRDVARANLLAMKSDNVGKGEVINIGAGNSCSIKLIAELVGGPIEYVEPRVEPRHTCADNTLAKKLLGWEPTVSIEKGIEELKADNPFG